MKIFFSYCRKNVDSVNKIAKDLEALGHGVWMDSFLTGARYGGM
jgi:hypothetical protein